MRGGRWFGRGGRLVLVGALASGLLVLTPSVAVAGVLDQSYPVFGTGSYLTCPNNTLVQTFTAGMDGLLDRIELGAWRSGPTSLNDLNIQIQSTSPDGYPTSFILAQEQLPASAVPEGAGPAMVPVPIDPPLRIHAGTRYAILLLAIGLPCPDAYGWQFNGDGSGYAAGDAFTFADLATLVPIPVDFVFNTYVDDGVVEEWPFEGFLAPMQNPPVMNRWLAATPIPIRFSVGGDRGLDILAAQPLVTSIDCRTGSQLHRPYNAAVSPLVLRSDGVYQFFWKTRPTVGGMCKRLRVVLDDGTTHELMVRFRPRPSHRA
jgi:hypothetical protein